MSGGCLERAARREGTGRTDGRHAYPVLLGFESIVCRADRLDLVDLAVTVEWGVSACEGDNLSLESNNVERGGDPTQQEVGDDSDRPHVDGLAVALLLEDLRCHVACAPRGSRSGFA